MEPPTGREGAGVSAQPQHSTGAQKRTHQSSAFRTVSLSITTRGHAANTHLQVPGLHLLLEHGVVVGMESGLVTSADDTTVRERCVVSVAFVRAL